MTQQTGNVLELVAQLAYLQRTLAPALPKISQRLIFDLLSTGVSPKALGKVLGRKPTYVLAIGNGKRSMTAQGIVDVIKYATAEQRKQTNDS